MKASTWMPAATILILVNLAWIWRLDQLTRETNVRMSENRDRFITANRELYLLNRGMEFMLKTNDLPLPENFYRIEGMVNGRWFDDFRGSSKKLVLVVSDRCCSTCVDQLLFTIKAEISETDRHNLLILYSLSTNSGEEWNYRRKMLPGAVFTEVPDRCLNLPADSLDIPYFFVTGPERTADLTFTPYPSLEEQTRSYLNLVSQRFFNP
jgi:hypothetical protein